MQLKRSFLSIHQGMLRNPYIEMPDNETAMKLYWDELIIRLKSKKYFNAGALALEMAPKTGTLHIQGYLEHDRKRLNTIAQHLMCNLTNGISVVKDAKGSWDYCAGLGQYENKHAIARFTWGEPKLHGSAENADLKTMVQAVIDGAELNELMRANPYAWCVHCDRIIKFHNDWYYGIHYSDIKEP